MMLNFEISKYCNKNWQTYSEMASQWLKSQVLFHPKRSFLILLAAPFKNASSLEATSQEPGCYKLGNWMVTYPTSEPVWTYHLYDQQGTPSWFSESIINLSNIMVLMVSLNPSSSNSSTSTSNPWQPVATSLLPNVHGGPDPRHGNAQRLAFFGWKIWLRNLTYRHVGMHEDMFRYQHDSVDPHYYQTQNIHQMEIYL